MPEDTIDVYQLLESLSDKTTDNELKKIIVQEVFEHKDDYVKYIDNGYEEITNKAFDKITPLYNFISKNSVSSIDVSRPQQ